MLRQRANDIAASTSPWTAVQQGGANPISPSSGTFAVPAYQGEFEIISDTERKRPNDNDCYHRKTIDMVYRNGITIPWQGSGAVLPKYYDLSFNWPHRFWETSTGHPFTSLGTAGLQSITGDPLDQLSLGSEIDASMAFMLPGIKPRLSLLNSIYELKDFKDIPAVIRRIVTLFKNIPAFRRRVPRYWKRPTLHALTKLSGEGYLSYKFAIAPLLQEIVALAGMLSTLKYEVEKLRKNANKRRVAHYVSNPVGLLPTSDTNHLVPLPNYYSGHRYRRIVSYPGKVTFRASMEYIYSIDHRHDDLWTDAVLDFCGLNLNPQILWNLLPWSFVVDWVLGVNRWLGKFQMTNTGVTTSILRYNYSIKFSRTIDCFTSFSEGGPYTNGYILTRRRTDDVYSRRAAVPDLSRHITLSGLNSQEFSYIGALLAVRV